MSRTELTRGLTSRQVSMIGLSGALGTGLFLGSGSVISYAGPATVISYLLAGLMALSVVWALAEMVSVHPVAGGHGTVSSAYLGRFGGYAARWNFAVTLTVAVGAEVTASATYLQLWFPNLPLWAGTIGCSALIIALNVASVHLYGSSEYWFSMIKVVAIISFIALGLALIIGVVPGREAIGASNLWDNGGFAPEGIVGILAATCMAVFSFGGVENVSVTAAESENPQRDIPKAAGAMIWRLIIFYLLAILVVLMLQPWTETAASGGIEESPFVRALSLTGVDAGAHIMNAILIVAALSAANGCLYASSRMIHALAVDGQAPRVAGKLTDRGVPRMAVVFAALGMAVAAVLSLVAPDSAFLYLYGVATVGILITWVITMLTHLKFRKLRGERGLWLPERRLLFSPIINWVVIGASALIFIALIKLMPIAWYAGIPYMIILIVSYLALARWRGLPAAPDLIGDEIASRES